MLYPKPYTSFLSTQLCSHVDDFPVGVRWIKLVILSAKKKKRKKRNSTKAIVDCFFFERAPHFGWRNPAFFRYNEKFRLEASVSRKFFTRYSRNYVIWIQTKQKQTIDERQIGREKMNKLTYNVYAGINVLLEEYWDHHWGSSALPLELKKSFLGLSNKISECWKRLFLWIRTGDKIGILCSCRGAILCGMFAINLCRPVPSCLAVKRIYFCFVAWKIPFRIVVYSAVSQIKMLSYASCCLVVSRVVSWFVSWQSLILTSGQFKSPVHYIPQTPYTYHPQSQICPLAR